jgi:KipI family sensor histidine kinase inhibitor
MCRTISHARNLGRVVPLGETLYIVAKPVLTPLGNAAVLVGLGDGVDEELAVRSMELAAAMRTALGSAAHDVVPAYNSVLVRFDPLATSAARQLAMVGQAVDQVAIDFAPSNDDRPRSPRHITFGVCFGGQFGLDFEQTAHDLGMRERRMRDLICQSEYRVAFLGFLAGFPYLFGLPDAFASAHRLSSPRPRVPAGSVAIAAGQCGIYPRTASGGWRLLGQTAATLFEPDREPAALLRPGDFVRFDPRERLVDATVDIS